MPVITISHQIGSGGREIGRQVAQKMGLVFVDHEIVENVAQRLGIPETLANSLDEKANHLIDQLVATIRYDMPAYIPSVDSVDPDVFVEATRAVLDSVAARGDAVIVGHGANFYLSGRPDLLHVFVFAPAEDRVKRLMEREKLDRGKASKLIHQNDAERGHYIKTYYQANWHDPLHYDLLINSSLSNLEADAELIVQAARQRKLVEK